MQEPTYPRTPARVQTDSTNGRNGWGPGVYGPYPVPDLEQILSDPRLSALLWAKAAMRPALAALIDADAPDLLLDARDLLARIAQRLNIQHREKFGRAVA